MNWEQKSSGSAVLFRRNVCWLAKQKIIIFQFLCIQMQSAHFTWTETLRHLHIVASRSPPMQRLCSNRTTETHRCCLELVLGACELCPVHEVPKLSGSDLTGFLSGCLVTVFSPKADVQCRYASDNKIMVNLTSADLCLQQKMV